MVSKDLELRGIPLSTLGTYLEELGASKCTQSFPYIYENEKWRAKILSEKIISFTSIIKVNSVQIRFTADNEEVMEQVLKNYSHKTIRAGG